MEITTGDIGVMTGMDTVEFKFAFNKNQPFYACWLDCVVGGEISLSDPIGKEHYRKPQQYFCRYFLMKSDTGVSGEMWP